VVSTQLSPGLDAVEHDLAAGLAQALHAHAAGQDQQVGPGVLAGLEDERRRRRLHPGRPLREDAPGGGVERAERGQGGGHGGLFVPQWGTQTRGSGAGVPSSTASQR
jgi:hypothetical protein